MRLSRIVIRRFKSIDQLEILIPEKDDRRQGSADFVSIVGENNVGKSTILDAIRMACPGSPKPTNEDFPSLNQAKGPIEVEFEFNRLTEKDKEAQAIRAHVFEEDGVKKYRVKKVWSGAGAPEHWAYNPNITQTFLQAPIVLDRSIFPNQRTFIDSIQRWGQASPFFEKRSIFRFSIGRTF